MAEREQALLPEKTAADLVWLGLDENGQETNGVAAAKKVLPENDLMVPAGTRALSKANRLRSERVRAVKETNRAEIVAELEAMIRRAMAADRVTDARYYSATLKSLYPDWKPAAETAPEKELKEEKK